jgi:GNAT superfamily N-acetyltransferase
MSVASHNIRDARLNDHATLVAFNQAMAEETEGKRLEPSLIEPGVARVLEGHAEGRYLIASNEGGQTLGSMMVTYEWSDWRCGQFWWIQSVYVVPQARRQGVFSALYRHLEAEARAQSTCCGLRLYVETENHNAMATYRHLGMQQCHYHLYEVDFSAG